MTTKSQTEQDCDQALAELQAELIQRANEAVELLKKSNTPGHEEAAIRLRTAIYFWEHRDE